MPSSISHAMAAVAIAAAVAPSRSVRTWAVVGVVCATAPDLDALPRLIGRGDLPLLGGHRGLTHSIPWGLATAAVLTLIGSARLGASPSRLFAYVALATLSHGVLDAFTDYGSGEGVGFFIPLMWDRFKAPWQPIRGEFSELLLCLLPLLLVTAATLRLRNLPVGIGRRTDPLQLGLRIRE